MQRPRLPNYRVGVEEIVAAVQEAQAQGFTDLPGFVIQGMTGMGIPVRDPSGMVVAALSVAAITERLSGSRRDLAICALKEAAAAVEARLRGGAVKGTDPSDDTSRRSDIA